MDNPFSFLTEQEEEFIYNMNLYPLCSAMCEALAIPELINQATGPRDERAALDFGLITKAFIINMLDQRAHLVNFADSFQDKDCEVLFGEGVTPDLFTEDRLGDTLDALSELDHRQLASTIAQRALNLHGVPVHSAHIDTTNTSFHGAYKGNDDPDSNFSIEYGKPKDGRSDLKLATFASAVQQDCLPLFGEGLSGNSSDVVYFRDAMDEMAQLYSGDLYQNPILVYDAAASNEETFNKSYETKMPSIIRLSRVFKIAATFTRKAWEEDRWQKVGTIAINEQASNYSLTSFDVELGDGKWRLLVIHSSNLQQKKESTASSNLPKVREKLNKKAKKLAKKGYKSKEEAHKAAEKFIENRSGLGRLFTCQVKVETKTTEKYARPGRPTPDSKKIKKTTYHPHVIIGELDPDLYQEWLEDNSCFILVSNVPKKRCSDQEILKKYKGQWKIENQYRFIKKPLILKPVWLHRDNRIKALLFILWLAVLVAAYLRHRLCTSLELISKNQKATEDTVASPDSTVNEENKDKNQKPRDEDPTLKEGALDANKPNSLYQGTINGSVSGRIQTPDGRLVEKPTLEVITGLFDNVQTKAYWKNGKYIKRFLWDTKVKIYQLIVLMGFHPSIYLEAFHPELDLWDYEADPDAPT